MMDSGNNILHLPIIQVSDLHLHKAAVVEVVDSEVEEEAVPAVAEDSTDPGKVNLFNHA